MDRLQLLRRIKAMLRAALGPRLRGVVLYGSEARGEAGPDSDIDLLLEGPVRYGDDLRSCIHAIYPLFLELERPIHLKPMDAERYEEGELPLYRHAKREGVVA